MKKGSKHTAETRRRMSKSARRRYAQKREERPVTSEETKQKIRDSLKKYWDQRGRKPKHPGRSRGRPPGWIADKAQYLETQRWRSYEAPAGIIASVKVGQAARKNDGLAIVLETEKKQEVFSLFVGNHDRATMQALEDYLKTVGFQRTGDDGERDEFDEGRSHVRFSTLKEKKEAARYKLIHHTERSDNWIGSDCGLQNKTVRKLRKEMEDKLVITKLNRFRGKDGKEYPRKQKQNEERLIGAK